MKLNRYILYLISYAVVAMATALFSASGEVRPVFNGHWFVKTPFKIEDFGLLIEEIDGQKKDPPVYFDRSGNLLGKNWSFDRYNLAQKIGEAYSSGNAKKLEDAIAVLKAHLGKKSNIHFLLQKRSFDPKVYIETGTVQEATNLKPIVVEFP